MLCHQRINDNQGGHGLDNRHSTRDDTRIMSSFCFQNTILIPVISSRLLSLTNRGRGLESNSEVNWSSICNSALNSPRVVRLCRKLWPLDAILRSRSLRRRYLRSYYEWIIM